MRGRFAPYVIGMGLIGLALCMLGFFVYALIFNEPFLGFLIASLTAALLGIILRGFGERTADPSRREALIGVLLLWLVIPAFAAVPFALSGHLSPLNAMFESMSGFTTTGATVIRDFESFPKSLFMWRSLIQWFGGVGIIVLFIAVLPQLAIAGRQLFFAEAPGPTEEKLSPRLRNTSNAVLYVYVGLTFACIVLYWLGGMSFYDAISHAFTTLAAGGFSPNGLSFQEYPPILSWISVIFMLLAGANFALLYRAFSGRPKSLVRDPEFKTYVAISIIASLLIAYAIRNIYTPADALRHGFFQSLSILTTTGYASTDFALWPAPAQMVLLILMFIGGSAGSAGGGIKVVRWLMIVKNTAREVRRALHPRGVFPVRLGGRVIPEEVLRAVAAFITLYVGLFATTTSLLVAFGADFVTAFTATIACIGNVGPGLASVGPMANFADLHPISRGLLTFAMYAGRLEVVTVFVVFDPQWWRLPRKGFRKKPVSKK
ncbi:MAG: TrkH family potassium uptake protein [Trueperaceae bacterium]|nr:TrkH family potassium uptake protein [Trueperaceae bacterium]